MKTLAEIRAAIAKLQGEARSLVTTAGDAALSAEAEARFAAIEAEVATLKAAERRAAFLDEADRNAQGTSVDQGFANLTQGIGLLDVIRAGMGATDAVAGRAREASQEMERRSGRKAQGVFWDMRQPMEARTVTTALPAAGPGGNLVPTDFRADLFIERLHAASRVRALGATVLNDLTGNVTIPRRKASVVAGWVAENSPLPNSDPQFDGITLSPKHAGVITEFSRNMVLQASPDVETLARNDMAATLAEVLDAAAIGGTGTNNQPRGILNTAGIGALALGTNGGTITYDNVADLVGLVDDANADGGAMAFLSNTRIRRALAKLKNQGGDPLGLPTVLQDKPAAWSNLVPSGGTKGTGVGLSSLIYGNWSDLLIGVWSPLDILVNPYESAAYSKGNVSIRAMMSVDVAVRHPESFAAITDAVA